MSFSVVTTTVKGLGLDWLGMDDPPVEVLVF